MLRIRMSELSSEDRERLRIELIALLTEMIYPPVTDAYAQKTRRRPISAADRTAATDFLAASHFDEESTIEITSSTLAEFVTDLALRYHEMAGPRDPELHRQSALLRSDGPRLATDLQRRLVAYVLDGAQNGFGTPPRVHSWKESTNAAPFMPPWEVIAPGSVALANALAALRDESLAIPRKPIVPSVSDTVTELLPVIELANLPQSANHLLTAPLPQPITSPREGADAHSDHAIDRSIYTQLQQQLVAAMMSASINYGITAPAGDPAGLLAALRTRDLIEDADLRLAEGILALCARVIAAERATIDDYRQALMLYLLFNRSRIVHS